MATTTTTAIFQENDIISNAATGTSPFITTSAIPTPMINPGVGASGMLSAGDQQAGPSDSTNGAPSAQQMDDLNFYLRRLTLRANGDMVNVEGFGGGPDYEMFLDAISSLGLQNGWTEVQTLRMVEMKLKDKAREYYGALLPMERPTTMVEMRNWFRRVFGRKLTLNAGKRKLDRCIRNPGEPLGEFAQRLKVIVNKMFPASSLTSPEKIYHRNILLVNQFIDGLEGRLANEILRAGEFYVLDDCLAVAEECEEIVSRMVSETRYDMRMTSIRRVEAQVEEAPRRSGYSAWRELPTSSYHRDRNEHRGQRRYRGNRNNGSNPRRDGTFTERFPYMRNRCTRCGEGHLATGCINPRRKFCYHCGKIGEICSLNSSVRRRSGPTSTRDAPTEIDSPPTQY